MFYSDSAGLQDIEGRAVYWDAGGRRAVPHRIRRLLKRPAADQTRKASECPYPSAMDATAATPSAELRTFGRGLEVADAPTLGAP